MDAQHFSHFVESLVEWIANAPLYIEPTVSPEDKPVRSGFNNRIAAVKRVESRLAVFCTARARNELPDDDADFEPLEGLPEVAEKKEAATADEDEGDDGPAPDKRVARP
ncbi:hypothetical protein [Massilia glaciei]|uniref:Uncharacterized protein n=1 Tax=Massilia glaciei TaxID=1524097 RepID=A0A2U2HGC3_9BURK|nr:hypothetical protein [Massilia glaciei]PWF43980.1 hypothetical protein C7C56_020015 [Massilia glaciei]